jgi:hypothetical protein
MDDMASVLKLGRTYYTTEPLVSFEFEYRIQKIGNHYRAFKRNSDTCWYASTCKSNLQLPVVIIQCGNIGRAIGATCDLKTIPFKIIIFYGWKNVPRYCSFALIAFLYLPLEQTDLPLCLHLSDVWWYGYHG